MEDKEIRVAEYDQPEDCIEFHYLLYPKEYVEKFHAIGTSTGDSGHMPVCKFIKGKHQFISFACYGTIEHPRTEMSFLTLIPNKVFDSKGYEDYKLVTTQEDLDEIEKKIWEERSKNCSFVFLDFSDLEQAQLSKPKDLENTLVKLYNALPPIS